MTQTSTDNVQSNKRNKNRNRAPETSAPEAAPETEASTAATNESSGSSDSSDSAEASATETKTQFQRSKDRLTKAVEGLAKGARYFQALHNKLEEDHEGRDVLIGASDELNAALPKAQAALQALSAITTVEFPTVRTATPSILEIGAKVTLRDSKVELYEHLFEKDDPKTLEVVRLVAAGKQVLCKTKRNLRQLIPASYLKLA